MVRLLWLLFAFTLVSCSPPTAVQWLTPQPGEVLSGRVSVEVKALNESPSPNAVLYANGKMVEKVALDGDTFSFVWNTQTVSPGFHVLEVRPFGEVGSRLKVEVSRSALPDETSSPAPPPPSLSLDDPFNINTWFEFVPELRDAFETVPAFDINDFYPRVETTFRLLAAEPLLLPRGLYTYDNVSQDWTFEPHAEDFFQATFSFEDADASTHDMVVSASYGPTEMINDGATIREMPRVFDLVIEDNGELTAEVSFGSAYTTPEGCPPQLEPTNTSVEFVWYGFDGGLGGQDPLLEETSVSAFSSFNDDGFYLDLRLTALREDASTGELFIQSSVDGEKVREACALSGFNIDALEFLSEITYTVDDNETGSSLTLEASEISTEPVSAVLSGELSSFETDTEDVVTTFEGELDSGDADTLPGTGVAVTLPSGAVRGLDTYLSEMLEEYTELFQSYYED